MSRKSIVHDFENLKKSADIAKLATQKLFKTIKKKLPHDLDETVHNLHEIAFSQIDCLFCANCCRTLGPRITNRDIEKLSRHLKIEQYVFIEKYLKIDEDNDYVFKSMPCPFLQTDNYCLVYSERPKACREFPHTKQRRFHQILNITLKNTFICPAVFEIVEGLKRIYKFNS